ncbi:MAG: response regulator transcription factor [Clostridia bacterium]
MALNSTVLVVEDDRAVRSLISTTLETHRYHYLLAENGRSAIMQAQTHHPDVILLDLGLPDIDGVQVISAIREFLVAPIIVVSARSEDQDKIAALDAGADDYLTKPFNVEELLARLRAALRRMGYIQSDEAAGRRFTNGDLIIDYDACGVLMANQEIHLTPMEYKILCLFAHNVGKVLTHNMLTRELWGNVQGSDISTLRVFMTTLRKKIEPSAAAQRLIQTHIGIGYCMNRIA